MKRFWKWFFIVLGVLVLIAISCMVAFFFFRGGAAGGLRMHPGGFAGRSGAYGGMMFGLGGLMFMRMLVPLGILVLAGFGVAYFVKFGKKPAQTVSAQKTCVNCGKTLSAEWTTCPYCGTKVETPVAETPKVETPKS